MSSASSSGDARVRLLQEAFLKRDPSKRLPTPDETQRVLATYDAVIQTARKAEEKGRILKPDEIDDLFDTHLADLDAAQVATVVAGANPTIQPRRVYTPSQRARQAHKEHEKRRERERAARNIQAREKLAMAGLSRVPPEDMPVAKKEQLANMDKDQLAVQSQQMYQFQEWKHLTPAQTNKRRTDRVVGFVQMMNQESVQWQKRAHQLYEDGLPAIPDSPNRPGRPKTEPGEASRCVINIAIPSESRWSMLTAWSPREAARRGGFHTMTDLATLIQRATDNQDLREVKLLMDTQHLVATYNPATEMVMCLLVNHDPVKPGDPPEKQVMLIKMHKDDHLKAGKAIPKKSMCPCWNYLLLPQILPKCGACTRGREMRFCSKECKDEHIKTVHADRPCILRERARRQQRKKKKRQLASAASALLRSKESRCEPDWDNIPEGVRKGVLRVDERGEPVLSTGRPRLDKDGKPVLDEQGNPVLDGVGQKIYDKWPFFHTGGSLQFAVAQRRKARATIADKLRGDLNLHPTFCLEGCTLFD